MKLIVILMTLLMIGGVTAAHQAYEQDHNEGGCGGGYFPEEPVTENKPILDIRDSHSGGNHYRWIMLSNELFNASHNITLERYETFSFNGTGWTWKAPGSIATQYIKRH